MIKNTIWTIVLCTLATILESTVIDKIAFFGVKPDLALCILVYSAYINGTMTGQVSGFFSGLFRDLFSSAPLGLNCLIRTLIGALAGIFKGSFFLDYFFMPVILCTLATIIKALIYLILHLIIGPPIPVYSFITSLFWIETGLNALSAPLLFLLLRQIKYISAGRR
jgi:rod shape-determining protein MreD